MKIPFNKPFLTGKERQYLDRVLQSGKLSGNGEFTRKCQQFLEQRYLLHKTLLTTSCTDALEMAALLARVGPGDEVILPSYTFVSTANAFALRGAKLVFADSEADRPNLDADALEALITPRTRVLLPVHYGGQACAMESIMALANQHNLLVVEDAAQALEVRYGEKYLGGIGHLGAYSFHETKNIAAGEGGALAINHTAFAERAEILWEKGTNRSAFLRGEIDKYDWVDLGSSFLPSELVAAFLWAQLEQVERIQAMRMAVWNTYHALLSGLEQHGVMIMPKKPHNAQLFYLVCRSLAERTALIAYLKERQIASAFHFISLHRSPYFAAQHDGRMLPNADRFSDCLLRLPLYAELESTGAEYVASAVLDFYRAR